MVLGSWGGPDYPESMSLSPTHQVRLRPATVDDAPLLTEWDLEPHVIASDDYDPDGDSEWEGELAAQSPVSFHLIAEVDGRPIGALRVIDPHLEPTHYWGEIGPGLRAIDIWIGPKDALNRGYGTQMMTQVLDNCFADQSVHGVIIDPLVSNTQAHRFYRRLGFAEVGRQLFNEESDCLVHRLSREAWESRARA